MAQGSHALSIARLEQAIAADAALRRIRRMQPVGGPGDRIFPPTYPGGQKGTARHIFEKRRIAGEDRDCVLLDSVQSQANRLEAALLDLVRNETVSIPHVVVDFSGAKANGEDLSDIGEITSLKAPHRIYDAIIRDSVLDGTDFPKTEEYKALVKARPQDATAVFALSPTALVFGAWNSTGQGGGLGAKFPRLVTSEIVGIGLARGERIAAHIDPRDRPADRLSQPIPRGERMAVRIDPLGIRAEAQVQGGPLDWRVAAPGTKGKDVKNPSKVNHSNVPAEPAELGVTVDYAQHVATLSFAGLRALGFGANGSEQAAAARLALAALALLAFAAQDVAGYDLRSRCHLVPEGPAPWEIVRADGTAEPVAFDLDRCRALLDEAIGRVHAAGLEWRGKPLRLIPQPKLVELVALSRAKALKGETEEAGGT